MTFNINAIQSAIHAGNGFQNRSHFSVLVSRPPWVTSDNLALNQIPFLCEETVLPGVAFNPYNVKPHGYGLAESRPIDTVFTPITFNMMCDGNGNVVRFFHQWSQAINNFNTEMRNQRAFNKLSLSDFAYPSDYETSIEIYAYDTTARKLMTWKLHNAWPLVVADTPVAWDQGDDIVKLPVTFAYKNWTSSALNLGNSDRVQSLIYQMPRVDPGVAGAIAQAMYTIGNVAATVNNVLQPIYRLIR